MTMRSPVGYMPLPTVADDDHERDGGHIAVDDINATISTSGRKVQARHQRDPLRPTIVLCLAVTCFYLYFTFSNNRLNEYIPNHRYVHTTTTTNGPSAGSDSAASTEASETTIADMHEWTMGESDTTEMGETNKFIMTTLVMTAPSSSASKTTLTGATRNAEVTTTTTTATTTIVTTEASNPPSVISPAATITAMPTTMASNRSPSTSTTTTTTIHPALISSMRSPNSTIGVVGPATPFLTTEKPPSTNPTTPTPVAPPPPEQLLRDYYVYTSQCHMPRVEPFSPQLRKRFKPQSSAHCAKDAALVRSVYAADTQRYTLHIDQPLADKLARQKLKIQQPSLAVDAVRCCYREVLRSGGRGADADRKSKVLDCSVFHEGFVVPTHVEAAIIECSVKGDKSKSILLQKDALSFVQYRNVSATGGPRATANSGGKLAPSILLIGIDSLSRFNFRRNMPLTLATLQKQKWFELEGYNKVGDNTFPNVLALLAGLNSTYAYSVCKPTQVGGLDKCPFIWHRFKEAGYRTAYAEDTATISTFNYLKKGFLDPPTDHYLRPFVLALERQLTVTRKANLPFCVGRKQYAEYIYDFAQQFAQTYVGEPKFGLFWTNSFTHNAYDVSSSMDARFVEYLHAFERDGVLDEAVVLLFSDHGIRFGSILELPSGFLEERLPMFFISLPPWLRRMHPEFVQALEMNRNLLTTPYDVYLTLQQLLELSRNDTIDQRTPVTADGCSHCQSLFRPVSKSRTCQQVSIPTHWCTCKPYTRISARDIVGQRVANVILDKVNAYIGALDVEKVCSKLHLQKIELADVQLQFGTPSKKNVSDVYAQNYRIKMIANPHSATFQATASYNNATGAIAVAVEDISRLDRYAGHSKCMSNKELKKYCICKK